MIDLSLIFTLVSIAPMHGSGYSFLPAPLNHFLHTLLCLLWPQIEINSRSQTSQTADVSFSRVASNNRKLLDHHFQIWKQNLVSHVFNFLVLIYSRIIDSTFCLLCVHGTSSDETWEFRFNLA